MKNEELTLTQEWDKTFPQSDKVDHKKVTFHNRYGITLAADMYTPKNASGKLSAIAVCGPFGAVKEQCSGLYAQTLAERGFITMAFDPSFTGESGGVPRYMASPDINTEDFQAAVDFLSVQASLKIDVIEAVLAVEPIHHASLDRLYNHYGGVEVSLLIHVVDNPIHKTTKEVSLSKLDNSLRCMALRSRASV